MRRLCLVLFVFVLFSSVAWSQKKVLIVRFYSVNGRNTDLEDVFPRSIGAFLKEMGAMEVIEMYKIKSKPFKKDELLKMGQKAGVDLVVWGKYMSVGEDEEEKIRVSVVAYDVISYRKRFEKRYVGQGGVDVFELIDRVVVEISGLLLGKRLEFGKLVLKVEGGKWKYDVFLGTVKVGSVGAGETFEKKIVAGIRYVLSVRNSATKKEVLYDEFTAGKDETVEKVYRPEGMLKFNLGGKKFDVFVDGKKVNPAGVKVPAGKKLSVEVKEGSDVVLKKEVELEEGETRVLDVKVESPPVSAFASTGIDVLFLGDGNYSDSLSAVPCVGVGGEITFRSFAGAGLYFLFGKGGAVKGEKISASFGSVSAYLRFKLGVSPRMRVFADAGMRQVFVKKSYDTGEKFFYGMYGPFFGLGGEVIDIFRNVNLTFGFEQGIVSSDRFPLDGFHIFANLSYKFNLGF